MRRMIITGVFAAGMLVTPLLATGAGASPTNPNPNAACISAIANGYLGGATGIGQFHNLAHPYGQAIIGQGKVRDCV